MSQLSPIEPTEKSSAPQPPSPVLQAILASLDVQLEDELARYRRRSTMKAVPTSTAGRSQPKKGLDLIAIKATGGRTQPSTAAGEPGLEGLPASVAKLNPTEVQVEAGNGESHTYPPVGAMPQPGIDIDRNSGTPLEPFPSWNQAQANLANVTVSPMQPNEYLESSEALLKNLNEEKATPARERSFTESLLTPLGIGSMLLLLLSSATLGYVATNPSSLSHLRWKGLFASRTPGDDQTLEKTANAGVSKSGGGKIPNTPNLASQEFVDLNLRSLSTITPKPLPKIQPLVTQNPPLPVKQPAPLPNVGSSPLDLPSALLPQAIQSGVLPQITTQSSTPLPPPTIGQSVGGQPNSAKPKASPNKAANQKPATPAKAKAAPPGENKFVVVMAYNGDRSLAEARKVVPDAHLDNARQGKRIQLAAFPTESQAKKKAETLRKQGLSAQVFPR